MFWILIAAFPWSASPLVLEDDRLPRSAADNVEGDDIFTNDDTAGLVPSPSYLARLRAQVLAQNISRAAAGQASAWSDTDLVVVPAVYIKWGARRLVDKQGTLQIKFWNRPFWSYEDTAKHRKVFLYQRLWEDLPYFVPNYGYEGAIYLRFIVDHYDDLPPVVLFVQDDYEWQGYEDCLNRKTFQYRPLFELHPVVRTLQGPNPDIEQCVRDFAQIFDFPFEPRHEVSVNLYPRNNFAVSRASILRRPLAQWQAAYAKAISPRCHQGPLDFGVLSPETLLKSGHRSDDVVLDRSETYETSGRALEFLSAMIYGFTSALQDLPAINNGTVCVDPSRDCSWDFMASAECPASPCI